MKKIDKIKLSVLSIIYFVLTIPQKVSAAPLEYKLLESIGENTVGESSTLPEYLGAIFNFVLSIAVILGVVMMVVAGVQYAARGISEKAAREGKERLSAAVFGLILAVTAWLILNTINPDLLKFANLAL